MILKPLPCPDCGECESVVKRGKTKQDKQRYLCQNPTCAKETFILDYTKKGHLAEVKRQIIDMCVNGSGIRDSARVLGISPKTVIGEIKKRKLVAHSQRRSLSLKSRMPNLMKCGVLWRKNKIKDGSGMPSIITAVKSSLMSWLLTKMKLFSNSKSFLNPSASATGIPMAGALMRDILTIRAILSESETPRKSSANI